MDSGPKIGEEIIQLTSVLVFLHKGCHLGEVCVYGPITSGTNPNPPYMSELVLSVRYLKKKKRDEHGSCDRPLY